MANIAGSVNTRHYLLTDDGTFPNNNKLPLLIYHDAVISMNDDPVTYEELFARNHWRNSWRNGIFNYHHYHSDTHEVLGIYGGKARVMFGGPHGIIIDVKQGDVIVIPAGVAHKCVDSSDDLKCVGAYPNGSSYDMNYGKDGERPAADENINKVPTPDLDPVYGDHGPLLEHWRQ